MAAIVIVGRGGRLKKIFITFPDNGGTLQLYNFLHHPSWEGNFFPERNVPNFFVVGFSLNLVFPLPSLRMRGKRTFRPQFPPFLGPLSNELLRPTAQQRASAPADR